MNEEHLNKPPKKFLVSFRVKASFFTLCLFFVGLYFLNVLNRRSLQRNFLIDNEMAAIRLDRSLMPDLEPYDPISNVKVNLVDQGSWTLLNVWATWCPSCMEEMRSLELLQRHFLKELKVVALSIDENVDAVTNFISKNKPSYSVLWDKHQIVSAYFSIDKYPQTFLISPEGELTAQFNGPRDWFSQRSLNYLSTFLAQNSNN